MSKCILNYEAQVRLAEKANNVNGIGMLYYHYFFDFFQETPNPVTICADVINVSDVNDVAKFHRNLNYRVKDGERAVPFDVVLQAFFREGPRVTQQDIHNLIVCGYQSIENNCLDTTFIPQNVVREVWLMPHGITPETLELLKQVRAGRIGIFTMQDLSSRACDMCAIYNEVSTFVRAKQHDLGVGDYNGFYHGPIEVLDKKFTPIAKFYFTHKSLFDKNDGFHWIG